MGLVGQGTFCFFVLWYQGLKSKQVLCLKLDLQPLEILIKEHYPENIASRLAIKRHLAWAIIICDLRLVIYSLYALNLVSYLVSLILAIIKGLYCTLLK